MQTERRTMATNAEHQRAWRDRQRGGPPRAPAPCGTYRAFRRHKRHQEPIDDACRLAYNRYQSLGRFLREARAALKGSRGERRAELQERIAQLEDDIERVR